MIHVAGEQIVRFLYNVNVFVLIVIIKKVAKSICKLVPYGIKTFKKNHLNAYCLSYCLSHKYININKVIDLFRLMCHLMILYNWLKMHIVLYDFFGTVKAAPHECVIRIGQP